MAAGKALKGKASKVGTAVRPLGNTTDTNPLDDRADNTLLGRAGRGIKRLSGDTAVPGKGARAVKGKKVKGGGDITGGVR